MRTKIRLAVLTAVGAICLTVPIVATGATGISGHLTGSQVVNPNGGDPNGTANISLRVNRQKARVCFVLTYKKLSGHVTGAFIHKGDEGDIDSAPVWWTFILLAAGAMLFTGLRLLTSPTWRPFGAGFIAGAIVPVLVVALLVLWLVITL